MRGRALFPRLVIVGLLLATAYLYKTRSPDVAAGPSPAASAAPAGDVGAVLEAFKARRSGVEVEATGVVTRCLAADRSGSQHERFLLRVGDLSVLVAHNTDLAPSVPLSPGDTVQLRGEYEWNQLGGVIHWTHRDPAGRHAPGWVRVHGRLYQ